MTATTSTALAGNPVRRVDAQPWDTLTQEMHNYGCALTGPLVTPEECAQLAVLYDEPRHFRSTINMERYRFGKGEYRYFANPLPDLVQRLRQAFYPRLLPIARDWAAKLGKDAPWPDTLEKWLAMCHAAGQSKPTAILLRYRAGDWNALHRDLYGDLVFPMQVVIGLNQPGMDFTGGEFLLIEQRPRAQSRGIVRIVEQGHGVSEIRSGIRHTLGLVFHDAG